MALIFQTVALTPCDSMDAESKTAVLTTPSAKTGAFGVHTSQIAVSDQRTCGDHLWGGSKEASATCFKTLTLQKLIFDKRLTSRQISLNVVLAIQISQK